MRQKNNGHIPWSRIMKLASFIFPLLVFVAAITHIVISDFSEKLIEVEATIFVGACLIARFLNRRSKNLQADFITVRIYPDADEVGYLGDKIALLIGVVFVIVSILLPFT